MISIPSRGNSYLARRRHDHPLVIALLCSSFRHFPSCPLDTDRPAPSLILQSGRSRPTSSSIIPFAKRAISLQIVPIYPSSLKKCYFPNQHSHHIRLDPKSDDVGKGKRAMHISVQSYKASISGGCQRHFGLVIVNNYSTEIRYN